MKTFNEFVNEGQQFLRSVSKNDKVKGESFNSLSEGDLFFMCGMNQNTVQVMYTNDIQTVLRSFGFTKQDIDSIDLDEPTFTESNCVYFVNYNDFKEHVFSNPYGRRYLNVYAGESDSNYETLPFDEFEKRYKEQLCRI